jgi:DNA-binding transcriptional MerR regulator
MPINAYVSKSRPSSPKTVLVSIGKAAKEAGVSRQSLQYYIMMGLLEAAKVTKTGRRMFDKQTIERVKLIKMLNKRYPLRAIRELFIEGRTRLGEAAAGEKKRDEMPSRGKQNMKGKGR